MNKINILQKTRVRRTNKLVFTRFCLIDGQSLNYIHRELLQTLLQSVQERKGVNFSNNTIPSNIVLL